ncbi:hypothetical protein ETD83_19310 [Actinomadura soli]|uniref:Uncharacterized protein n=1 Tax=Actinomadura soli TaxID=2508997 RepID=A0A5C4JAY7_9ACTN|nr:hypothetical protein [Actinomadura soli]TMQ98307.1 hypothetical protein ETD83_19310 [Actinomadura soli]
MSPPPPGRVVIQAAGLDGTPAFSVVSDTGRPLEILDPNGTLIGTLESDQDATGAEVRRVASGSPFGSVLRLIGVGRAMPREYHLLRDASGRRLCGICWEQKQQGHRGGTAWVPTDAEYTDANGARIARLTYVRATKAEYTLKIEYRLSEPLRTLVLASPLAFALVRG